MTSPNTPVLDRIAIVGVGLIGGSIAAAIKSRKLAREVVGVGRSRERLEAARDAGLIDAPLTRLDALRECSLVVVCTPVDRIVDDVMRVAGQLPAGTLVTDAGSVKESICAELEGDTGLPVQFVGSHPLAGSEQGGWEHADANLFAGRTCVVTPVPTTAEAATIAVERFWRSLGMRTVRMSPAEHDRKLALTSHLPHVAAAALASLLSADELALAATGFRDTTRVASGDPRLWAPILQQNSEAVGAGIDRLIDRLQALKQAAASADQTDLIRLLDEGKSSRERASPFVVTGPSHSLLGGALQTVTPTRRWLEIGNCIRSQHVEDPLCQRAQSLSGRR